MRGPSAERSKNKKYENLGVEGVVLQDYDEDIDAMMDDILNGEKRPTRANSPILGFRVVVFWGFL